MCNCLNGLKTEQKLQKKAEKYNTSKREMEMGFAFSSFCLKIGQILHYEKQIKLDIVRVTILKNQRLEFKTTSVAEK
jgi:hypothetical protein